MSSQKQPSTQHRQPLTSIEVARRHREQEQKAVRGILDYGGGEAREMLRRWKENNPDVRPRGTSRERRREATGVNQEVRGNRNQRGNVYQGVKKQREERKVENNYGGNTGYRTQRKAPKTTDQNIQGPQTRPRRPSYQQTQPDQPQLIRPVPIESPVKPGPLPSPSLSESVREQPDGSIRIKLVLVGDGCVGKTSMLISYTTDRFPSDYVPTIFDNQVADIQLGPHKVKLELWDTAGQEQYAQLRLLSYRKADIFFVCFSMVDQNSFNHALNKWYTEVREECPQGRVYFVGTKWDLHREYVGDAKQAHKAIPVVYIEQKCRTRGCEFLPCSGMDQKGLCQAFDKAMYGVIQQIRKPEDSSEQQSLCQLI